MPQQGGKSLGSTLGTLPTLVPGDRSFFAVFFFAACTIKEKAPLVLRKPDSTLPRVV